MNTRKKEKMFALVDQWKESGITRKAFAREQGIHARTFYYWCEKQSGLVWEPAGDPGFVELAAEPSEGEKSGCPRLEIELAGGIRIKIY